MESSAALRSTRVLLTGPPGIGKTTVCKKIAAALEKENLQYDGFYTEEVRAKNAGRIGFDIVLINNPENRSSLARAENVLNVQQRTQQRVGKYCVFPNNFEAAVLPILSSNANVLLIDEIGKMELFSGKFYDAVTKIFFGPANTKTCIVATIPLMEKIPPRFRSFFNKLRTNSGSKLITVSRENRDKLPEEIMHLIKTHE